MQAILPPRKEFLFYCNLTGHQRLQYLDETNRILCHNIHGNDKQTISDNESHDENDNSNNNENENENLRNNKKTKMKKFDDCSHLKIKNRNKSSVKGVLPNIMKLRQICNFAEFTDCGINGNGSTDFSNRECALQFIEHSAKLKVRHLKFTLLHFFILINY